MDIEKLIDDAIDSNPKMKKIIDAASGAALFPDRIWVGYFGGGRIWGPEHPETHPNNVRYVREERKATVRNSFLDGIHDLFTGRKTVYLVQCAECKCEIEDGDNYCSTCGAKQ